MVKALTKVKTAANALSKVKDPGLTETLSLVEKMITALRGARIDGVLQELELHRTELARDIDATLARRREDLHQAAKSAGWKARTLQNYDHVGFFRVEYKKDKVTLQIGSEKLKAFDEVDGQKVFSRIMEARTALESFPFERDAFFGTIKNALRLATIGGTHPQGKVPVREVYPLVVLVRQSQDKGFMKLPCQRNFGDYSICQFVYDLARFGKDGWGIGNGESLRSRTPNMSTIDGGKAITLPVLEGEGRGTQFATLWIEKA